MDNESRRFLSNNPESYSTLGNVTPKFGDDIPEYDNKNWDGRVNYYKWEHGITGKKTQSHNKPINFWPNYSGAWAVGGVAFEYTDKGWDALEQKSIVKDVEVPMAIWGKVLHLRNTLGAGENTFVWATRIANTAVIGRYRRNVSQWSVQRQ